MCGCDYEFIINFAFNEIVYVYLKKKTNFDKHAASRQNFSGVGRKSN